MNMMEYVGWLNVILMLGDPNLKTAIDVLISTHNLNVVILGDWLLPARF